MTRWGKAMRAAADNEDLARVTGIDVEKTNYADLGAWRRYGCGGGDTVCDWAGSAIDDFGLEVVDSAVC